jgi:hypothetical protein
MNTTTKGEENALLPALYKMQPAYRFDRIASILSEHGFNSKYIRREYIRRVRQEVLSKASFNGLFGIVLGLLDIGANVNGKDLQGRTPLMNACLHNGRDAMPVLKLLIERGASIQDVDSDGRSALAYAVENSDMESAAILLLIEAGADVHQKDHFGATPLMRACTQRADTEGRNFSLLLKNGARIDDVDITGGSVLGYAIAFGHVEIVKLLVDAGVDVNHRDSLGGTPLLIACYESFQNSDEIVQFLVAKGAGTGYKCKGPDTRYNKWCRNTRCRNKRCRNKRCRKQWYRKQCHAEEWVLGRGEGRWPLHETRNPNVVDWIRRKLRSRYERVLKRVYNTDGTRFVDYPYYKP